MVYYVNKVLILMILFRIIGTVAIIYPNENSNDRVDIINLRKREYKTLITTYVTTIPYTTTIAYITCPPKDTCRCSFRDSCLDHYYNSQDQQFRKYCDCLLVDHMPQGQCAEKVELTLPTGITISTAEKTHAPTKITTSTAEKTHTPTEIMVSTAEKTHTPTEKTHPSAEKTYSSVKGKPSKADKSPSAEKTHSSAKENPAGKKPAEENPVGKKPANEKPDEKKPAKEESSSKHSKQGSSSSSSSGSSSKKDSSSKHGKRSKIEQRLLDKRQGTVFDSNSINSQCHVDHHSFITYTTITTSKTLVIWVAEPSLPMPAAITPPDLTTLPQITPDLSTSISPLPTSSIQLSSSSTSSLPTSSVPLSSSPTSSLQTSSLQMSNVRTSDLPTTPASLSSITR
ncbi:26532_t:CDS:1 [Gigaspora margarita]|uniref:26532_t:CDS:1 n=1 Tax=Gigaspora margarita TaxID=4874 RepID=A0ABN7W6P6_GIGMA|nr:26532_t:CDS:1 [Gigaspora margarita]